MYRQLNGVTIVRKLYQLDNGDVFFLCKYTISMQSTVHLDCTNLRIMREWSRTDEVSDDDLEIMQASVVRLPSDHFNIEIKLAHRDMVLSDTCYHKCEPPYQMYVCELIADASDILCSVPVHWGHVFGLHHTFSREIRYRVHYCMW